MKCLIAKEICKIDRSSILLGDFIEYLENAQDQYDWIIASGVLYHMRNPLNLLQLISKRSSKLVLWTHYYDADIIQSRADLKHKFEIPSLELWEDNKYTLVKYKYLNALEWSGFCGGPESDSMWLTRESLLLALSNFGYVDIQIGLDEPMHPNGPSILIAAQK